MRRLVIALLLWVIALPALAGWNEGAAAYGRADWPVAARELIPLADRGDPRAQALVGRMLLDGHGLAKDEAEAIRRLRQAADQGDPTGQYALADAILSGRAGTAADLPDPVALLHRAADAGLAEALHRMGMIQLFGGNGAAASILKDPIAGERSLRRAADLGWGPSREWLGLALLDGLGGLRRDPPQAVILLRQAADQGLPTSQFLYASALIRGLGGLAIDHEAAADWLRKASNQGYAAATNLLARMMISGDGMPRDVGGGIEMLRRAAEKGDAAAAETLGLMFWGGGLVQKDHVQAMPWLRQAAEKGLLPAQNTLGYALWYGDGIPQDRTEAVTWFRRAAEKGWSAAQHSLGEAYANGLGVERNLVEALSWYLQAIANAGPADNKAAFERDRDRTATLMLPAELDQARALAASRSGKPPGTFIASAPAAPAPPSSLPPASASPPAPSSPTPAPAPGMARPGGTAGTGFFVSRDGVVLTDSHVVTACRTIRVTPSEGPKSGEASLMARDSINDLAALKTAMTPADIARFRDDKPMRPGDGVVVIGYPLSNLLSREPNVTVGVISALAGPRGDGRYFQITAPVQRGNSGGPLADMSGNVVGIVESKLNAAAIQKIYDDMPQNVSFATKAELIRHFLADNGISATGAPARETLSAADVGERVKRATVLIECLP